MSAAFPHASVVFGCPIAGEVAPISQCADPTFAQGLLGPGVVIQPEGSILFAPADGWNSSSPLSTPWAWRRQRA